MVESTQGKARVVFFGAHTDDEMICAGSLHRLVRSGYEVHVVTFAPAAIESDRTGNERSVETVTPEWNKALDLIGVKPLHRCFHALTPSADLQKHRQFICQQVYDYCEMIKPEIAFILSPEDENTAHAVVGIESERVMRGRVPIVARCLFPWNYGNGRPNFFITLDGEDLDIKTQVIETYQSQLFRYNYRSMLLHSAYADGLSVKVGAAEKFELIRWVY